LLDSNICIYILEGLSAAVRRKIETFEPGEVATSAIAYAEVMRGVDPTNAAVVAKTQALFTVIDVLPFDRRAADLYRTMPFRRGTFNRLIGAHALALGLTLVTNNVREYAGIDGLSIENWTKE
jgi:tRNA(fMet)-specific endonuclease VapC